VAVTLARDGVELSLVHRVQRTIELNMSVFHGEDAVVGLHSNERHQKEHWAGDPEEWVLKATAVVAVDATCDAVDCNENKEPGQVLSKG
jgi:hypothetical protein